MLGGGGGEGDEVCKDGDFYGGDGGVAVGIIDSGACGYWRRGGCFLFGVEFHVLDMLWIQKPFA
jgi:hypothetical protein